eukprot:643761-Alexandrium_andersonii.AAC.1
MQFIGFKIELAHVHEGEQRMPEGVLVEALPLFPGELSMWPHCICTKVCVRQCPDVRLPCWAHVAELIGVVVPKPQTFGIIV